MSHFVVCSIPEVIYRGRAVENHAVNIDLCQKIRKTRMNWYPDNVGIPSIDFDGCDAKWAFNTMIERDTEYDRIVRRSPAASNGER